MPGGKGGIQSDIAHFAAGAVSAHSAAGRRSFHHLGKYVVELEAHILPIYAEHERPTVKSPADAANLLMLEMGGLEVVRVGELFREAIRVNAAAIIVAHNHPSGDPTPSAEDVHVTRQMVEAGKGRYG